MHLHSGGHKQNSNDVQQIVKIQRLKYYEQVHAGKIGIVPYYIHTVWIVVGANGIGSAQLSKHVCILGAIDCKHYLIWNESPYPTDSVDRKSNAWYII